MVCPISSNWKFYPEALLTRTSHKVEFPTNSCCAYDEPQPAILEEIEFREVLICRKCAERMKGKKNWSMPRKELGLWDRIKARRTLTKLIQINTPSQPPQWL